MESSSISEEDTSILLDLSQSIIFSDFSYNRLFEWLCESLDVIKSVSEPPENVIESEKHSIMLLKIASLMNTILMEGDEVDEAIRKNNRHIAVTNIYIWLLKNYKTIDVEHCRPIPEYMYLYNRYTQNERKLHLLSYLAKFVNQLIVKTIDLRVYAIEHGILEWLIKILDDEEFLPKIVFFSNESVQMFVFNLNWLSKIAEAYKSLWHELDAIRVLLKTAKSYPNLNLYLYMATANVAYDKEIENLVEIHEAIDRFVDLTNKGARNEDDTRIKQEFIDEENHRVYEFEVISVVDKEINATISITGLLLSLYRLSVNDKIKFDLFQKPDLKDSLKNLIYSGNDIEKEYSIELLAQLCFDDRVNEELRKDTKLVDYLKSLIASSSQIVYKKLIKTSKQLIWLLNEKQLESKKQKEEEKREEGHIMISYNTGSRDLCLKIKESLENTKLKVWIDVDEIHGSSLESMARAVENAQCVLVCVTEKYRQSVNCQAEAQYAFRLQKKIIPLILQKGYGSVDGWLGIIIGDKIFIDFTKYEYDDSFKRLLHQIDLLTGKSAKKPAAECYQATSTMASPPAPVPSLALTAPPILQVPSQLLNATSGKDKEKEELKEAYDWDESKVEQWFKEKGFESFFETLKPLNGKVLYQLFLLQRHTPEFFFKSLSRNDALDLKSIALFSSSLCDLFK